MAQFLAAVSSYKDCTGHFVEENGEGIIASFTIILAVSTIGLWLATKNLWAAGEKQFALLSESAAAQSRDMQASLEVARKATDTAVKTSEREFRAYVSIMIVGGSVEVGKKISFGVQIINYGRTPAERSAFESGVVVRRPGWTWDLEEKSPTSGTRPDLTVHPNEPVSAVIDSDFILSSEAYKSIEMGNSVIYANGLAVYRDVFGSDHETRIAFEFSGAECFRSKNPRMSPTGNYAK